MSDCPTAEQYWAFSLATYAEPQVAQTLLVLQDDSGVSINLVLLLGLCQRHQVALSDAQLAVLEDSASACERTLLTPYRQARRGAKAMLQADADALYQQLKVLELQLEQWVQGQLHNTLVGLVAMDARAANGSAASEANEIRLIENYLNRCGVSAAGKQRLLDLLEAPALKSQLT